MKSRFEFVFSRVFGILLLSIAGSALAQGVFPPNGQLPALWAIPPGAVAGWNVANDAASEGSFSLKSAQLFEDPTAPADKRQVAAIESGGTFSDGTISFAYQVSSEANFDLFQFYIDGQLKLEDSGIVNFRTVSFSVPAGYHTFRWAYNKDNSQTVGSDAAWIDAVVLPPGTLGQQLNLSRTGPGKGTVSSGPTGITCGAICTGYFTPGTTVTLTAAPGPGSTFGGWGGACAGTQTTCQVVINAVKSVTALFNLADDNFPAGGTFPAGWTTPQDSTAPWGAATDTTYRGNFSLKSGVIPDNAISSIQISQQVSAGTIDFAYRVSSEFQGDTFAFYIDDVLQTIDAAGVRQFPASGEIGWTPVSFNVSAGSHIFKFQYQKDVNTVAGSDAAWIDAVSFPPTSKLLTVTTAGSGTGTVTNNTLAINCGVTCAATFTTNTVVTLTATPANGSTFAGWLGACTGTTTCQVTLSQAQDVTASFYSATQLSLTVNKAGNGGGTVTSGDGKISCGATCSASYAQNAVVNLQATPDSASTFTGWSGACSGTGSCQITMDAAKNVTASFAGPSLTVTKAGSGSGTVTTSPSGISCGATCSASFASNQLVTLTAAPASGSVFAGWTGACSGSTTQCQVTMDAAKSVTASFSLQGATTATLTVTRQGTGSGTVTSDVGGINCGSTCSATLNLNTSVQLTATVSPGSVFSGWTGGCVAQTTTCTVTLDQSKTVVATFTVSNISGVLDVDGSSPSTKYDAMTDGLLVIRYLYGLTGTPLVSGATGPTATRNTGASVQAYLDGVRSQLDVDGNGTADALTDGLMIVRYMFGLRGQALIAGAIGSGAMRSNSTAIEAYIQSLMP